MRHNYREIPDRLPLRGLISTPFGHDRQERWPLLLFLHGADEAGPTLLRTALTRHGPLREGNNPVATSEFVVVAPQLPRMGDPWRKYDLDLALILNDLEPDLRVDPSRIYICGVGVGADGALEVAATGAYPFAAVWAVEPTLPQAPDPEVPLWVSAGPGTRPYARQYFTRLHLTLPRPAPTDRVFMDEGVDTSATATLAYADSRVYRWLLKYRRRTLVSVDEVLAPLREEAAESEVVRG